MINIKPIVTCSQMKELDRKTIQEKKVPSCVLMERAALKTVEKIEEITPAYGKILVVCGSGNNGGDGIAIARLLHLKGRKAYICFIGNFDRMTEETRLQWEIAMEYQIPTVNMPLKNEYTTIVDAIFGVGLSRIIEGRYATIIDELNQMSGCKIAVDIPSGINGDTGEIMGTAFQADYTVTFAYNKLGLGFYPGREYTGKLTIADIGIYGADTGEYCKYMEAEDLKQLPYRSPWGNKGTFGKILFVAGSKGMCGAAYMSAHAALKTGVGMVLIQTDESNRIPIHTLLPEAMVSCKYDEQEQNRLFLWSDIIVIGPGLGKSKQSRDTMEWYLKYAKNFDKPLVIDADGLNLLSENPEWKKYLGNHVILTPHPGEMARLTAKSIKEVRKDILATAEEYAVSTGVCCVFKDACTAIVSSKREKYLNLKGNSGMATAGSGDVLAGIMAGVLAMYMHEPETNQAQIAAMGVLIHSMAGDKAGEYVGERAMTATDIIRFIPEILKNSKVNR